jgi:hypothetical protein
MAPGDIPKFNRIGEESGTVPRQRANDTIFPQMCRLALDQEFAGSGDQSRVELILTSGALKKIPTRFSTGA